MANGSFHFNITMSIHPNLCPHAASTTFCYSVSALLLNRDPSLWVLLDTHCPIMVPIPWTTVLFPQVAQALGMTLPARKRKASAVQAPKTLQGSSNQQPQQQQRHALPAAAVATAEPPAPSVKRQRRAAGKPPLLPGEPLCSCSYQE